MSYKWKEYFELAKELESSALNTAKPYSEASHRSSISRAYYAAYNSAKVLASNLGYKRNRDKPCHVDLISFFEDFPDDVETRTSFELIRKIGIRLNSCKSNRVEADYFNKIEKLPRLNKITLTKVDEIMRLM